MFFSGVSIIFPVGSAVISTLSSADMHKLAFAALVKMKSTPCFTFSVITMCLAQATLQLSDRSFDTADGSSNHLAIGLNFLKSSGRGQVILVQAFAVLLRE